MSRRPIHRSTASVIGALLALASAASATSGCASASSGRPPQPGTASSPNTAPPATITLDEHAARTTVHVRTGTDVVVRLHSTYWSTPASSDPQVLPPVGSGAGTPGGTCPPGGGCGIVSARFTAARPGIAHVTAHRTSCGEAMRCSLEQSSYDVTVAVGIAGAD